MQDTSKYAATLIRQRIASLGLAIASNGSGTGLAEDQAVRALDALAVALERSDVALFVDYLRHHHGKGFIDVARTVLASELPSSLLTGVAAYVDAAEEQLATWQGPGAETPGVQVDALRADYLEALLEGDRHRASSMILSAVDRGLGVRTVYQEVFQIALHDVGQLWQQNLVTVAQEHYITAATQLIMSQLYPRIFSTERRGRRFVGTCVSGELHEVGVRMVADFFEMDGWDTYYLGANVPPAEVVAEAKTRRADVVGVSATLTAHIPQVAAVVEAVRSDDACANVRTLVGGQAFVFEPDAWRRTGADGHARSAEGAVSLASGWMDPS
ncbi:MAG: cobalamin B12-binding domain-containing protein [Myxococcota bacterium]